MLKVGLTGGIGSGKSTVAEIFSSLGITIIDADQIAHQLTRPGTESFDEIIQLLGAEFIRTDGGLDRKKLAQTVFSNPAIKGALEKILHPKIRRQIEQEIAYNKDNDYIILAIPLLLESNFSDLVDRILVIDADDNIRIQRIKERDGRSEKQIRQIMGQQINRADRLQQADDIIENNSNFYNLKNAISQLHLQYSEIASR
ncbi:MAG: dephospho-CoA kinase [Gammaproteobacteria bacterium]|nr:dephospho-CoA kinase [Gammaproteobacteria bacterium]MCW8922356.1 dephospho-CoA kinase [Gammaproteobacteria bacterium]